MQEFELDFMIPFIQYKKIKRNVALKLIYL